MGREKDGSLNYGTDVVEDRERIRRCSPGNSGGGGGKGSGEEDVKRRKSRRSTRDDDSSSGSSLESDTGSESEEETRRRSRKAKEKRKSYGKARRRRGRDYDDDDSSSGSGSDSESDYSSDYSDSDESESEEERRRRKRKRREKEEREKKRMKREKEKKRRRKEKDEERDRKRKKKKEKEKRKKLEKGKKGAVTNSWGKYGIIRETDMWNKRPEFTAWLAEIKQVNLESLPPWEEKKMFKEFMEDHNTATFPSKKYYNIDAYERRKMEKEMKKGFKKVVQSERVVFNDEEQRRLELQQAREKQKEEEVIALKQAMEGGMAQAMREQARLKEEMTYLYKIGNIEAAAAIQKRLDPDVPM